MVYTESYKQKLERQRRENLEAQERNSSPQVSLEAKINRWWSSLTEEEKSYKYSMEFFENLFGVSGRTLGPVLYSLGFERKRHWQVGQPHRRIWVKCRNRELTYQTDAGFSDTKYP